MAMPVSKGPCCAIRTRQRPDHEAGRSATDVRLSLSRALASSEGKATTVHTRGSDTFQGLFLSIRSVAAWVRGPQFVGPRPIKGVSKIIQGQSGRPRADSKRNLIDIDGG